MFSLFQQGGPLFMGILSLLFIGLIIFIVQAFLHSGNNENEVEFTKLLARIKSLATLALVIGILGQLIGLFSAMQYMESSGGVSAQILAGGFKVSMITTIYGIIIYTVHLIAVLVLKMKTSAS